MNNSRRDFIKKSALLATGATTLPLINKACSESEKPVTKEIGVQLWSVREQLEQNFEQTLTKVADIGFDYVEAFGLNPTGIFPNLVTANQLERTVSQLGMRVASCHAGYFQAEDTQAVLEVSNRIGTDWTIIAWIGEEVREDYYAVAENLNKIGEQFKGSGIGFGYHNHDFEFFETANNEIPMEILLQNTDPELVSFQADLYWFTKAGVDPMEFINRYPGRFVSYHVKDANEELEQTTVGEGIIDFETILNQNEEVGIQYVFVEDERTNTPIKNIEAGHDFLKNLDY